ISCEYTINIARLSDQQEWWEGVIGHFSNPGYPVPYAADQMCSWIVSSPISHVLLTFPEFDLLDSENCHVDYVEIFYGNTDESQSFGRFCGSTAPRVVVSTAKQLYIRFVSGHVTGTGHTGFTAEYCEGPFTYLNQSHGEIVERDVGHAIYFLEAAENHRIYIEFPHFNLPHTDTSGRVSIYEGFGPESMNNQIAMFFHTNAHPVLSHTNTVKLDYKMDSGWYTDGIIATYKMIETDFKEIFGAGEGNISVPMDKVYKDYEWIIYAYDDVNVVLEFQEFMLMSSNDCNKESVELRRGPSKTSALMARLCGDTISRIFTADVIHVMFTTESIKSNSTTCEYNIFDSNMGQIQSPAANLYRHVSYRYDTLELGHFGRNRPDVIKSSGHKIQVRFNIYSIDFNFIAEYVTEPLDERFACAVASNVVYGEHEGNISSSNYPAPYPVHQECVWHIVTEKPASIIYLSIEDFVLEDASGPATCSYDYLSVYDGPVLDSPLIGTYCGNEIPHRFVSTGPGMTLLFRSNKNKQKRGFQLHYQAKCYKVYTNPSGTIEVSQRLSQSVFFDNECTFEIQGSKDHAISLEFTALGIEFDKYISGYYPPSQASHYVDVLMGKNKELAVRYYGNMLAPWITLPTSPVYIVYHLPNRYYEPSARFNITYQREEIRCEWPSGMLYVDEYGKIKNPWRKNTYPSNQSCEFAIASQYGGPVRLRMNSVDLDAQSNTTDNWLDCVNYIEVDNRGDRLCHLKQQTQYITSGTSASVKFNSGINQGIGSFNLEYDSACGISDVPEGIPNIYEHTNDTNFNSVPRAAPWMGLLYDVDEAQYICSVVLLNDVWAISTAHCISARYGHKLQIKLGKTYSNVTEPDEVSFDIVVQNCDMYRTDYLMCLFKLDREVTFTSYIRPICLPTLKSKNSIRARAGSIAFTFGWGRDFDNFSSNYVLQRIPLRSIDWKTCVENKQDLWAADRTFLCAEYMDGNNGGKRCYGHSGGPLAKYHNGKWFMIGIVANGPPHSAWHNEGCPRRGKYGWFWRTVKVDTFIKNILYQD
uniref:Cubilin-like n=1 Tax=Saccoglossus kowalevskii TaxID=10224 RepID=A0ABM0LZC4_SACKO